MTTPYAGRLSICRNAALAAACAFSLFFCTSLTAFAQEPELRWWKGNLHTHSVWSDGDDYPEMIAEWYKANGYHFVAFTEHNMLQEGDQWYDITLDDTGWPLRTQAMRAALPRYRERFGTEWVDERVEGDRHLVRVKPLSEFRHFFEEPGRFMLLAGEEITDHMSVHLNAVNLQAPILPQGGETVAATLQRNVDAVHAQREETGRKMFVFINHPNFQWALTAEDIAQTRGATFFEVHNAHQLVNNEGDEDRPGTERIWDLILALRHSQGNPEPMYGLATDDAHNYRPESGNVARPGRAWVMVQAPFLTPESIIDGLEAGRFYATTGIVLRKIEQRGRTIRIEIEPEDGVRYRTQFIGTRHGAEVPGSLEGRSDQPTGIHTSEIGEILAEVDCPEPAYELEGDEIYVRAKVISSKPRTGATSGETLGLETAWTQPFRPQ